MCLCVNVFLCVCVREDGYVDIDGKCVQIQHSWYLLCSQYNPVCYVFLNTYIPFLPEDNEESFVSGCGKPCFF